MLFFWILLNTLWSECFSVQIFKKWKLFVIFVSLQSAWLLKFVGTYGHKINHQAFHHYLLWIHNVQNNIWTKQDCNTGCKKLKTLIIFEYNNDVSSMNRIGKIIESGHLKSKSNRSSVNRCSSTKNYGHFCPLPLIQVGRFQLLARLRPLGPG